VIAGRGEEWLKNILEEEKIKGQINKFVAEQMIETFRIDA
jgi:hypothetical protein